MISFAQERLKIPSYMISYVHIIVHMSVYACICVYARIYCQKGLYTLKMDVIITAILAQWQRSSPFTVETGVRDLKNAEGVLHPFEYLFAIEFQERPSCHVL